MQLINLASLTFLDFEVNVHKATESGHVGKICIILINILTTVSFEILIGTVKQIMSGDSNWFLTPGQP